MFSIRIPKARMTIFTFNMDYKKFSNCFSNVKDFNRSEKPLHNQMLLAERMKYVNKDLNSF